MGAISIILCAVVPVVYLSSTHSSSPKNLKSYVILRHGARSPGKEKGKPDALPFIKEVSDMSLTYLGGLQARMIGDFIRSEVQSKNVYFEVVTSAVLRSVETATSFEKGMGNGVTKVTVDDGGAIARGPKTGLGSAMLYIIQGSDQLAAELKTHYDTADKAKDPKAAFDHFKLYSTYISAQTHQLKYDMFDNYTPTKRTYVRSLWKRERLLTMGHKSVGVVGGKDLFDYVTKADYRKDLTNDFCVEECRSIPRVSSDIKFVSSHDSTIITLQATLGVDMQKIILPSYASGLVLNHVEFAGKVYVTIDYVGIGLGFEVEQLTEYSGTETYKWGEGIFGVDAVRNSKSKGNFSFFKNVTKSTAEIPSELCELVGSCDNVVLLEDLIQHGAKYFDSSISDPLKKQATLFLKNKKKADAAKKKT